GGCGRGRGGVLAVARGVEAARPARPPPPPRRAAGRVVVLGKLDGEPAQAVHRVAGAVERALYAPPGADVSYPELAADVRAAGAALLAAVGRRARLRALLLPRSGARVTAALSLRAAAASARLSSLTSRLRIPLRGRG
ncbi:hypothetical protein ACFVHW_35055, partial [Streptomyces sp. NPDC127110]